MLIKLVPEDFRVRELTRVTPGAKGPVSVYELSKRKIDTFEALRRVSARSDVPLDRIAYVGLKDRQAVTTQLISVERGRIDTKLRIPGIRLRYLGRLPRPLSAEDLLGNAFELVVRDMGAADVQPLGDRLTRLERHGLINYFDDQRFGSLVAGQGLPGRHLVEGDFEAFLKALLTTPGKRDPLPEKKFKHLVAKTWGDFDLIATKWGNRNLKSVVAHLRRKPDDFAGAIRRMPGKERALHVFAYQSWIWNRTVARYLERELPRAQLSRTSYSGGEHVWLDLGSGEEAPPLVETFPLLDASLAEEGALPAPVRAAVDEVLAEEGLTLERFTIEGIPGCFFKHYERPLIVRPEGLSLSGPLDDDRREGRLKVHLGFTLPPGAYATLVLKRLFGALPAEGSRAGKAPRQGKEEAPQGKASPQATRERGRAARAERPRRPARRSAQADEARRGRPAARGPGRDRAGEGADGEPRKERRPVGGRRRGRKRVDRGGGGGRRRSTKR